MQSKIEGPLPSVSESCCDGASNEEGADKAQRAENGELGCGCWCEDGGRHVHEEDGEHLLKGAFEAVLSHLETYRWLWTNFS